MAITKKQRKDVEMMIYKVMDLLDPTEQNSNWYKAKFKNMNDKQFEEYFKQVWPIKFQARAFEIEPKMDQICRALDFLHVPLMEDLYMPFLYKNKDNEPVKTNYPALVIYVPMRKMQQFISKKNSMSVDIDDRNMKTGRLINRDKNGNMSDREMECLAVMGLDKTLREFATYRGDSMKAKTEFYSTINDKNMVSLDDVDVAVTDSISRNTLNAYLIGAHINTNLINIGNYSPLTLKDKHRIKRE